MALRDIMSDFQDALNVLESDAGKGALSEFKKKKSEGALMLFKGALVRLKAEAGNDPVLKELMLKLERSNPKDARPLIEALAERVAGDEPQPQKRMLNLPRLPVEIREDVAADAREVQACLDAKCYRSSVILCGRMMETALHRKYFEATGQDLLEKAPGIGLGNLIAKLAERGVKLDPGLSNQIHLINQVRVFSVHTKQDAFAPSKNQAEAIVLYTLDILEKLFK